jgi:hypothetical protein
VFLIGIFRAAPLFPGKIIWFLVGALHILMPPGAPEERSAPGIHLLIARIQFAKVTKSAKDY